MLKAHCDGILPLLLIACPQAVGLLRTQLLLGLLLLLLTIDGSVELRVCHALAMAALGIRQDLLWVCAAARPVLLLL